MRLQSMGLGIVFAIVGCAVGGDDTKGTFGGSGASFTTNTASATAATATVTDSGLTMTDSGTLGTDGGGTAGGTGGGGTSGMDDGGTSGGSASTSSSSSTSSSTSSSSSSSSSTSSSSSSSSSSGGTTSGSQPGSGMYSPCDNAPSECNGDVPATGGTCVQIITDTTVPCTTVADCTAGQTCSGNSLCADINDAFCSINNCTSVADCDPSPGGTATVRCLPNGSNNFCVLDCGAGRTCPTGMTCYSIGADSICA